MQRNLSVTNKQVHSLTHKTDTQLYTLPAIVLYVSRTVVPRAGSGAIRIDPLLFLAGCRTRRLNQALSVLPLSLDFLSVLCC